MNAPQHYVIRTSILPVLVLPSSCKSQQTPTFNYTYISAQDNHQLTRDRESCTPLRSTETWPRCPLQSRHHTVSRYMRKCNFSYAVKKNMAFPGPILTKLRNAPTFCSDLLQGMSLKSDNTESTTINNLHPHVKCGFYCDSLTTPTNNLPPPVSSHSSCVPTGHQELS